MLRVRLVKTVPLPQKKSIYFIEHNFASGAYSVQLFKEGKLLHRKKLVVRWLMSDYSII